MLQSIQAKQFYNNPLSTDTHSSSPHLRIHLAPLKFPPQIWGLTSVLLLNYKLKQSYGYFNSAFFPSRFLSATEFIKGDVICMIPPWRIFIFLSLFSCPSLHSHRSGVKGGRINSIHPSLSTLPTHRSQGQSPTYCAELSGNNKKLLTEPDRIQVQDKGSWSFLNVWFPQK